MTGTANAERPLSALLSTAAVALAPSPVEAPLVDEETVLAFTRPGGLLTIGAASLRFDDDEWHLTDLMHDPTLMPGDAVLRFGGVAPWLRADAKRWVAHLWLEVSRGPDHLQDALKAVRLVGRALPDYGGTTASLGRSEALRVQRYIVDSGMKVGSALLRSRSVNGFAAFLRRVHAPEGPARFVVRLPKEYKGKAGGHAFGLDMEKVIPVETRAQILDACAQEELAYEAALQRAERGEGQPDGMSMRDYLARAIKAQAVKLFICTGRRAKSICLTPATPRTEPSPEGDGPGVTIWFHESKVTDAPQPAFAPSVYGDIALDAIRKAQRFGQTLRDSTPRYAGYLFVIPGSRQRGEVATLLKPELVNQYLRFFKTSRRAGEAPRDYDTGLLGRYAITVGGDIATITSHNFRHTRATSVYAGLANAQVVSQDLNHLHPDMAVRHYIGMSQEARERHELEVSSGAIRVGVEALGDAREIVDERITPEIAARRARKLLVLQPTAYGFCTYPAESGPCPTARGRCWVGIEPRRDAEAEGCGCEHQVLAPHAREALEDDAAVLEENVRIFSATPETVTLAEHFGAQLLIVRRQLAIIETDLEPRLRACAAGNGGCCGTADTTITAEAPDAQ